MAADEREPYQILRKILPFTTALVVIVAIYVGYIVFTRWKERHEAEQQVTQQEIEGARKSYEAYGRGQVTVLNFTVTPGVMSRGDTAILCYGVSNAKTVVIDPKPEEGVWPSLSRCVSITPKKTTTYTITAQGENGHSATQSVTVNVQ